MPVLSTKYSSSSSTRCCPGNRDSARDCLRPSSRYSSPYCHCCPHISSCFQTAASLLPRKMSGSPPLSSALRKGRRLPVSVSSYTSPPSSRLITSILPPAAHSHTSRRVETASDAYNALFCSRYVQSIIYLIYILTGDVGIFKEIYLSIYFFGRKPFKRFDTPINDRYN